MRRFVCATVLASCPLFACTLLAPSDADLEGWGGDASARPGLDGATPDGAGQSDGAPETSCAPNPAEGAITCGDASCSRDCNACCASSDGTLVGCVATSTGCGGGVKVGCSTAADCPGVGGVCCASFDRGGNLQGVTCRPSAAACTPCCGGHGQVELLCDPNAAAACPAGQSCSGTADVAGDFSCQ